MTASERYVMNAHFLCDRRGKRDSPFVSIWLVVFLKLTDVI